MNIINKRNVNAVPFEDLYTGCVFVLPDKRETFYMKTEDVGDGDNEINCVELSDGSLYFISDDEEIIPIKAELHII